MAVNDNENDICIVPSDTVVGRYISYSRKEVVAAILAAPAIPQREKPTWFDCEAPDSWVLVGRGALLRAPPSSAEIEAGHKRVLSELRL